MLIAFNQYGTIERKLTHGTPARQGTGSFDIICYFKGLTGAYATITISDPNNTTVVTETALTYDSLYKFNRTPNDDINTSPFIENVDYPVFKYSIPSPADNTVFSKYGTYRASVKLYATQASTSPLMVGLVTIPVERSARDNVTITETEYQQLLARISDKDRVVFSATGESTDLAYYVTVYHDNGTTSAWKIGGSGGAYEAGTGIDITGAVISVKTDVIATKADLTSYATTTQLNTKMDKTGDSVTDSSDHGFTIDYKNTDESSEVKVEVFKSNTNTSTGFTMAASGENKSAHITSVVTATEEKTEIGAGTNKIVVTPTDAVLTTMGNSNGSIATKYYVLQEKNDLQQQINTSINTINAKIPSEASSLNQLADKAWALDQINAVAAYYITKNAAGDAFATKAELTSATTFYSGGQVRVPTRNDFCYVLADETHQNATTKYSYQGNQWEFQIIVNESPMTQAQLDAINSGITETKRISYDGYATTKQDTITSSNKLSPSLVNTDSSNRFVSDSEKTTWNGKQNELNSTNKLNPAYVNTDSSNRFVSDSEKSTWNGKSVVSVSDTGTATDEVQYIIINGVEKKLAGGGGSAEGAVKYNEAQTLTTGQKAQARSNIGASKIIYIDFGD